jgi:hypothetical protein
MFRVAVTNLRAEIIYKKMLNFPVDEPADQVLVGISRLVEETVVESRIDTGRILGVGVRASGLAVYQDAFDHPYTHDGIKKFASFWDQTLYE